MAPWSYLLTASLWMLNSRRSLRCVSNFWQLKQVANQAGTFQNALLPCS